MQVRERLDAILRITGGVAADATLARALHGAGLLAEKLGEYATCRALLAQSVALARQFDDRLTLAMALDSTGRQAFIEGRYAESHQLLEESHAILRATGDRSGLARVVSHLGFLELLEGRPATGRAIFEEGLALAVAVHDQHRVAEFLDNLGNASDLEGHLDDAAQRFAEAIAIWRRRGQGHWLAMALNNLGKLEVRRGDFESARAHLVEALTLARRLGNRRRMAYTLAAVANVATAEGDTEWARSLEAIVSVGFAEIGAALRPRRADEQPAAAPSVVPPPTLTLEKAVDESLARLTRQRSRPDGLTRRERDVVALLVRGLTNRQIAEALVVTEGTAENYVQRIRDKLGLSNRAQIAVWGAQRGIGSQPTLT